MVTHLDVCGLTDRGKVRDSNQDQFLIASLDKSLEVHQTSLNLDDHARLFGRSQGKLMAVADGMGGHAGGERASQLAVDGFTHYVLDCMPWFYRLTDDNEDDFLDELKAAMEHSQQRICASAKDNPELREMGTTLTLAYLSWPRLYILHVGDSRCYLLRDGEMRQLTRDHTVAEFLAEQSARGRQEVEPHSRFEHVLWNVLGGGSEELAPEVSKIRVAEEDCVLLCTDGVTGHLSDERITAALSEESSAEASCRRLIDEANADGGSDNLTVIVACFRSAEDGPAEKETAVDVSSGECHSDNEVFKSDVAAGKTGAQGPPGAAGATSTVDRGGRLP